MARIPRRLAGEGGFTLVEVMVALAILGLATATLLYQRVDLVREARQARDLRTAWVLAAHQLARLELDRKLWVGEGGSGAGDFSEIDPEFGHFTYEFSIGREEVPTNDPQNPDEKPKEIFRLRFAVGSPDVEQPIVLEAFFPVEQGAEAAEAEKPAGEGEKKPEEGASPEGEKEKSP